MALLVNSTKYSKEELIPNFHKIFKNIEEDRTLPNSLYEARILVQKPGKDMMRELQTSISYECRYKNPQQNTCTPNAVTYRKCYAS